MQATNYHEVEAQLIEWIRDMSGFEGAIEAHDNFIKSGWLDSFAVLGLIMQIEQYYSFKFEMHELANPELQVIQTMAKTVFNKMHKNPK